MKPDTSPSAPTLVPVRSSWSSVDGVIGEGNARARGYRCNVCGKRGHNARTCGVSA